MRTADLRRREDLRQGNRAVVLMAAIVALVLLVLSGSAPASSSAMIESESATNITSTDATLGARIDTGGRYTAYEFQIDTNGSYNYTKADCPLAVPGEEKCESITDGPPLPPGLVEPGPAYIPAGSGGQSVSLDLADIRARLQPSTTYHFRVITSGAGQGPDQTFTTLPAGACPNDCPFVPPYESNLSPGMYEAATKYAEGALAREAVRQQEAREQAQREAEQARPVALLITAPPIETTRPLTKTQKLANALKACKSKRKKLRAGCEKLARRRYGTAGKHVR